MAKLTPKGEAVSGMDVVRKAIKALEKEKGPNIVIRMGDAPSMKDAIEVIPSGSWNLDKALGRGGWPRGRIAEVCGPESGGKTTVALHAIAEAQRLGGLAAFIDAEHALDPTWAANLGVTVDDLLISQPDSGEDALQVCQKLVETGAIDLIVVDSVAALTPRAELDGEVGDQHVALQARMMSQALRKLRASVSRAKCVLMFINQVRTNIGVTFGDKNTTSGGRALRFYASVRVSVAFVGRLKDGEEVVGGRRTAKVVKNKVAPPFQEGEFSIMFGGDHGYGIDPARDILMAAVDAEVVDKSGAWLSFGGDRIAQGFNNAAKRIREHDTLLDDIRTALQGA